MVDSDACDTVLESRETEPGNKWERIANYTILGEYEEDSTAEETGSLNDESREWVKHFS